MYDKCNKFLAKLTNDYEYIFHPYYNETISQKINKKIRECSNEKNVNKISEVEQYELSDNTSSGGHSGSQCNLEACAECIIKAGVTHITKFYSEKIDEKTITTKINNLLSELTGKSVKKIIYDSGNPSNENFDIVLFAKQYYDNMVYNIEEENAPLVYSCYKLLEQIKKQ